MQRIQFYPSEELANILNKEAQKKGVSVSRYVADLLEEYYGMNKNVSITQLTEKVLEEVEDYIAKSPKGKKFDLNMASATYETIPMTNGGRPQTIRASIGRSFCAKLGTEPFTNVRKLQDSDGRYILSVNNALMYELY